MASACASSSRTERCSMSNADASKDAGKREGKGKPAEKGGKGEKHAGKGGKRAAQGEKPGDKGAKQADAPAERAPPPPPSGPPRLHQYYREQGVPKLCAVLKIDN